MTSLHPVRFKYLLGEWHLASWRPQLLRVERPTGRADWPSDAELASWPLTPGAEGLWCRNVSRPDCVPGLREMGPWLGYVPRRDVLHEVEIDGTFEHYLSRWSSKSRYNLRRAARNVTSRNTAAVLHVATRPEEMRPFLTEAAAISRETYQSRLLQSGLDDNDDAARQMEALALQGMARGYLLRDQGRAIAFAWCEGSGDRLRYEVIGYREETAQLSPGSVLLYLILEELFALGRFRVLDFGVGDAPYKRLFGTRCVEYTDAYLFPPTMRNRARLRSLQGINALSAGVGLLLERMGVKERARHLLRRLARG
jgi:CelD/BcsL family acetyltransferase involved in cellulose biosynthesis